MERIGEVAYKLALSSSLEGIHNVFHISQLQKYIPYSNHIVDHSELDSQLDLSYKEQPLAIMDRSVKTFKNKEIPLVLVSWNRIREKPPGNEGILFRSDILIFLHLDGKSPHPYESIIFVCILPY